MANRHIHRIQFSMKRVRCKELVKKLKRNGALYLGKQKNEKLRNLHNFEYGFSTIQLVSYTRNGGGGGLAGQWTQLSLIDANKESQLFLKSILQRLLDDSSSVEIFVSQIEFTIDFFPSSQYSLDQIKRFVSGQVALKHAHVGFFSSCETTKYQGRKGMVRDGAKGLRVYPRVVSGLNCYRVELQLNRDALRRLGLNLFSLPVTHEAIDLNKFLKVLSPVTLDDIDKALRHKIKQAAPKGLFRKRMMLAIYRRRVLELMGLGYDGHVWAEMTPIEQNNATKIIRNELGVQIRQGTDRFS